MLLSDFDERYDGLVRFLILDILWTIFLIIYRLCLFVVRESVQGSR